MRGAEMLAERIAERNVDGFLRAFERKDFTAMAKLWADDVVMEFQPGLPMAGTWQGIEQVRGFFEAVFAYNKRFRLTRHRVAVLHPWSVRGDCTIFTDWEAEEERNDGHVMRTRIISVAETHRWKTVRSRDYFYDVPAVAAHYAGLELPRRDTPPRAA